MATLTAVPKGATRRGKPDLAAAQREIAARQPATAPGVQEIRLDLIDAGENVRHLTSLPEQKSLVESVRTHGILQPIRIRPIADGRYQVVAGFRRFAAAKSARLKAIPALVAVVDDDTAFTQALVENLQREDLNPLDEAKALAELIARTKLTQVDVGARIGRSQSYVANSLRLLDLEPEVRTAIEKGTLSASHGKNLAGLEPGRQRELAKVAVTDKVSSRELEEKIRAEKQNQARDVAAAEQAEVTATGIESAFTGAQLDKAKVTIHVTGYGNGSLVGEVLKTRGYQVRFDADKVHETPGYECKCQATNVVRTWQSLVACCVVPDHWAAHQKTKAKERAAQTADAAKSVEKSRTAAANALRQDDGKGSLNIDGQRVALYLMLQGGGSYVGGRSEAFVKRHGGEGKTAADLFQAVIGLSEKDLGDEFARLIAGEIQPNVWGEDRHQAQAHWYVRHWMAEQFNLQPDTVFGVHPPTFQVLEQMKALGLPLTAADEEEIVRVLAERERWKVERDALATREGAASVDETV